MVPRGSKGIEPHITRRMAADDDHLLMQRNIRTLIERDESWGHGGESSTGAIGGDTTIIIDTEYCSRPVF
jgi:hypothetical protein